MTEKRIHKYRAWDTKRKKMWSPEEMGRDQLTLSPDGRGFVNVSGTSTKLSQYLPHLIPLQYTGRKARNKTEVYEADIILSHYKGLKSQDINVVLWNNDNSEYARYRHADGTGGPYSFDGAQAEISEVIGNIHQNPELLEKK